MHNPLQVVLARFATSLTKLLKSSAYTAPPKERRKSSDKVRLLTLLLVGRR